MSRSNKNLSSGKSLTIVGATGRMGIEIAALAPTFGFALTPGVSRSTPLASIDPDKTNVVIDFSLPEAVTEVVNWCIRHNKPLVSGVTGINDAQREILQNAGSKIPVLWSPNMSLGVAVMARLLGEMQKLEGFDFQLEELHHSQKRDKPSGTALFLQEKLETAVGRACPPPVAIRGGGIFGVHKLWAMGAEEVLTIEHTAMNRRVFARGALQAATWLLDRKPGFYRMDDVLGA